MELESPPEYKRLLEKDDYAILNDIRDFCSEKLETLSTMSYGIYQLGDFESSSDIANVRRYLNETIAAIDDIL